jgi:hypothetical protein
MITLNGKVVVCKDYGRIQNPLSKKCEYCGGKLVKKDKVVIK